MAVAAAFGIWSMALGGSALAACDITAASVSCAANTTTTNSVNINGGIASSSDRIQVFNNGFNVTGAVSSGVTVDGFGLQLTLGNVGGNNTLGFVNSGAITNTVSVNSNALQLNGNGGQITYSGAGSVEGSFSTGLTATNTGSGGVTITNGNVIRGLLDSLAMGVNVSVASGTVLIDGTGDYIGVSTGINAIASGAADITINGSGAVSSLAGGAIVAQSQGGDVVVAQTNTLFSFLSGITASTTGSGTVTVTTGGTITLDDIGGGNTGGIVTSAVDGKTTINVGHNIVAIGFGTQGPIRATGAGAGDIEINHTAGQLFAAATNAAVIVTQSGSGNISFSRSGGIFTTGAAVNLSTTGTGNVAVSFTGGSAINGTLQSVIKTAATSGATTISTSVNVTSVFNTQAFPAIEAISTSGNITISGSATITGIGAEVIKATSTSGDIRILGLAVNGGITASSPSGTVGVTATSSANSYTLTGLITALAPGGTIASLATTGVDVSNASSFVSIVNNTTISNAGNAIAGTGSAANGYSIVNNGTLNGNINVGGSSVVASTFANAGTWNAAAANSSYSGSLNNTGTVNLQNGSAGQVVSLGGNYTGNGTYRVDVDASGNADRINAAGTATLTGGSVNALFLPGSYVARNYIILSAAGGLGGTTFNTLATTNLPAGFVAGLTYTATDVELVLVAELGGGGPASLGGALNGNQQSVATSINNFFNNGGTLPPVFVGLFGLPGTSLGNALTQLSGEGATGMQGSSGLSAGMFLNAMLDPFATGRDGGFGAGPAGYAAAHQPSWIEAAAREAFAASMPVKAAPAALVDRHWTVWGSAYGGRNSTDGDTEVGSNERTATVSGFAAGLDRRVAPGIVVGLATAIGETRWSVAGLGSGRADVAQVGGYGSTRWQNFYLSGAVAGAWYKAHTDRAVTVVGVDRLEAGFDATSISARLEAGYRFGGVQAGITPYAAVQVVSLRTPGYSETAVVGSNQFALSYAAQTTTDTRSEVGLWGDMRYALPDGGQVIVRSRAAWVHDFDPDSRIGAVFQTLPGASFVVDGAANPRDAALLSGVAEWRLRNGLALIGKADGEFSPRAQTYGGPEPSASRGDPGALAPS